jgi:hypothetical protein
MANTSAAGGGGSGGGGGNGTGAGAGGGLIMIGTDEPHPLINASAANAATAAHNLIFFMLPPHSIY